MKHKQKGMTRTHTFTLMKPIKTIYSEKEKIPQISQADKPFVSVVTPAYNEAVIIAKNLERLCKYMETLEDEYRCEIIVINDGSTDETGNLAEAFARDRDNVCVLHHMYNLRLGQAFRSAFNKCRGDYVVTMDLDLSYSPNHIEKMLVKIRETRAKIVIASPYMEGGKVSNVPFFRKILSRWANRFLSFSAKGYLSTFTGLVRAYDGIFLSRLNFKSKDMGVHPEIIYKAMLLDAQIEEIPAHLNWGFDQAGKKRRKSSIKILSGTISCLLSVFMFSPFMYFMIPVLAKQTKNKKHLPRRLERDER